MIKSFTFVKKLPGLSDEEFFERWATHTRDWDLRDHPEITLNRIVMIDGDSPYIGLAENEWPDAEAMQQAAAWYGTAKGQEHWADLCSFMDIANSPTVMVTAEADISAERGISITQAPVTS